VGFGGFGPAGCFSWHHPTLAIELGGVACAVELSAAGCVWFAGPRGAENGDAVALHLRPGAAIMG